jgi:hypothetical protein|tara:strand:- start:839 stop:1369 length:531 start_codon:yes stop_codon:yes gene_type:complete
MSKEGWIPITTVTGSGNPASIDITSIPSTYAHLCLIGNMASTRATALEQFTIQLGSPSIDTGSNYQWQRLGMTNNTTVSGWRNTGQSAMYLLDSLGTTVSTTSNPMVECMIFGYADTNRYTNIWAKGGYAEGSTYGSSKLWVGTWGDASAVSALRVTAGSGNFTTASRLTLYGFKA